MLAPNPGFDPHRALAACADGQGDESVEGDFLLIAAPAKINLYLGVHEGVDAQGYHRVDTVMTAIDLADTLAIALSGRLMVKTVPETGVAQEANTAYKAAQALGRAFGRDPRFAIIIDKRIPLCAGLGGPSTDAAATILGICRLWGIDTRDERVEAAARSIGVDVPFFLYGPPAHLDGRGERLRELFAPLTDVPVALVKPLVAGVPTVRAYRRFDEAPVAPGPLAPMIEALRAHDEQGVLAHISNNLAPVARELCPEIARIQDWMGAQPGVRALDVCGSGGTVFAVCDTQEQAATIARAAAERHGWWARDARMEKTGPIIAAG